MAIYSVEGKLGTGKTKFCVWRAQDALREGLRVASNVDLNLDKLLPNHPRISYQRIPDKPTAADLHAIGHGNPDSYDEERNGLLILDELGSWLNSRSFQDKDRLPVIDWLIHARKMGWHVYFIVQDSSMIDKQVREALIEYQCRCVRLDKVKIPLFGSFLSIFHKKLGYLPRLHSVTARVGYGVNAFIAERWHFRGDDLHAAYDTRQVFRSDYEHGTHTVLHGKRFGAAPSLTFWQRIVKHVTSPAPVPVRKAPSPLVAKLATLPPDERIKHVRAFIQAGAI